MTSWDDLRILLAVARHGSHAAAGRALGVAATTIGRRIAALESELGSRLVRDVRSGGGLTEAGAALAARVERAETELVAAERGARGADAALRGPVRVSAPDGLTTLVLAPALPALLEAHPGMSVVLAGENRAADLSRREADVAFRMVRPDRASLVAKKLATLEYGIFASDAWLARHGRPRTLDALATAAFLGFEPPLDRTPEMQWLARRVPDARVVLRTTGTTALVAACAAGAGVALLPEIFVRAEPRLVRILPRIAPPSRDLYGVCHEDLRGHARVRAVLAWGGEVVGARRA